MNRILCFRIPFILLRHILKILKAKFSTQMGHFHRFFSPDICQLRSRHIAKYVHITEREIMFWPNCCKFAVECAWNLVRFLKTFEIWVFFEKVYGFLEKKLRTLWRLEKLENMMSVFSKKKTFSSFWKPSSQKWEAQNMPLVAGSLVLCKPIHTVPTFSILIDETFFSKLIWVDSMWMFWISFALIFYLYCALAIYRCSSLKPDMQNGG